MRHRSELYLHGCHAGHIELKIDWSPGPDGGYCWRPCGSGTCWSQQVYLDPGRLPEVYAAWRIAGSEAAERVWAAGPVQPT